MCRKSKHCVQLGHDTAAWSRLAPLPPPDWFSGQAILFRDAAKLAAEGDRAGAIGILQTMRSDEMRYWFDEHGQVSGRRRAWALRIPAPMRPPKESLDPRRSL